MSCHSEPPTNSLTAFRDQSGMGCYRIGLPWELEYIPCRSTCLSQGLGLFKYVIVLFWQWQQRTCRQMLEGEDFWCFESDCDEMWWVRPTYNITICTYSWNIHTIWKNTSISWCLPGFTGLGGRIHHWPPSCWLQKMDLHPSKKWDHHSSLVEYTFGGFLKWVPNHPFYWDFPLWTIHFGIPPWLWKPPFLVGGFEHLDYFSIILGMW